MNQLQSLAKLRRIEDAESCLRRSVLLNNTLRRLQREQREDKATEQHHPHLRIGTAGVICSALPLDDVTALQQRCMQQAENRLDAEAVMTSLVTTPAAPMTPAAPAGGGPRSHAGVKRRRLSDLNDESAPPPMMMMTPAESVGVGGAECEASAKKLRLQSGGAVAASSPAPAEKRPALKPCNQATPPTPPGSSSSLQQTTPTTPVAAANTGAVSQVASPAGPYSYLTSGLSGLVTSSSIFDFDKQYSCGQSSLFGELQSVVVHSLITSLES